MKKPNSPINDQINLAHKNDKPKAQFENEGAKRKKEIKGIEMTRRPLVYQVSGMNLLLFLRVCGTGF